MLLLKNDLLWVSNRNSASYWTMSQRPIVDYFPKTARLLLSHESDVLKVKK